MHLRISALIAAGLTASAGCAGHYEPRPEDVEVVRVAAAPGGARSALLVRHINRAALSSDTYDVLVAAGRPPATAAGVARLSDTAVAALHATGAVGVGLRWAGDTALTLVCANCGLEAIDVMERRDRIGPVWVAYEGFPRGTADSAP